MKKTWYYKTEKCNQLQKYSLKEEPVNMEIKREYCLDKLIKRQKNGLIKVITGIRRCGVRVGQNQPPAVA